MLFAVHSGKWSPHFAICPGVGGFSSSEFFIFFFFFTKKRLEKAKAGARKLRKLGGESKKWCGRETPEGSRDNIRGNVKGNIAGNIRSNHGLATLAGLLPGFARGGIGLDLLGDGCGKIMGLSSR
jgi:hypothetical protein